jgi:hypothetical protein
MVVVGATSSVCGEVRLPYPYTHGAPSSSSSIPTLFAAPTLQTITTVLSSNFLKPLHSDYICSSLSSLLLPSHHSLINIILTHRTTMHCTSAGGRQPAASLGKLFVILVLMFPSVLAVRMLESRSLSTCMASSQIATTYFHAIYTPDNTSLAFDIEGDTQVAGNVTIQVTIFGYGYNVFTKIISPCSYSGLKSICPMVPGPLPDLESYVQIPQEQAKQVPSTYPYLLI